MSQKRFETIHDEHSGMSDRVRILRDTQTGVCYLWTVSGYAGGLTPLLGADGRPQIGWAQP